MLCMQISAWSPSETDFDMNDGIEFVQAASSLLFDETACKFRIIKREGCGDKLNVFHGLLCQHIQKSGEGAN